MMIEKFEVEWGNFKGHAPHGSFPYDVSLPPFGTIVDQHFARQTTKETHGVYVIRRGSTGEVLRVGKAGTVRPDGTFKAQDLPRRLKNVKGDTPANAWFRELGAQFGPILIEYISLPPTPHSPSYVEARLLQAFLNEYGRLPDRNNEF
jgi:hypothetical protein